MNKVILMGRLTKDPDVRYSAGANPSAVARYSIAVDRKIKQEGAPTADFVNIVAFGKAGEFVEKYLHKGTKVLVTGRIQTGSYTNKDGQTVYTTDVVAEEQEFAESKSANGSSNAPKTDANGFTSFPTNMDVPFATPIEGDLPFATPRR